MLELREVERRRFLPRALLQVVEQLWKAVEELAEVNCSDRDHTHRRLH